MIFAPQNAISNGAVQSKNTGNPFCLNLEMRSAAMDQLSIAISKSSFQENRPDATALKCFHTRELIRIPILRKVDWTPFCLISIIAISLQV
jgi:hypothetical protein